MTKIKMWVFVSVIAVIVIVLVLLCLPVSTPNGVHTPQFLVLVRTRQIYIKLRYYADEHSTFPSGVTTNDSIGKLVSIGILSADDAAYIRDHQVEYRGFDLSHISADVPVFVTIVTNSGSRYRIVTFSDGHGTIQLEETP